MAVRRSVWRFGVGAVVAAGCAGKQVQLPAGYLPVAAGQTDVSASGLLNRPTKSQSPARLPPPAPLPPPRAVSMFQADDEPIVLVQAKAGEPPARTPFELPRNFPGASAPPVVLPRFPKDATQAERDKTVKALYPELTPAPELPPPGDGPPLSLADLQAMAAANSPVLRRAAADAAANYGQVIQAGLHPNPTVGYQADQVQPRLAIPPGATFSGAGQQGGFINQLIKTAGKLSLAQRVAGFDYINALVAVRRAQVDVTTAVRGQYFGVLVARQGVEVNRALADLADEVYRLQLKQAAVGEASYEPLQLFAQAEQARVVLAQSDASYRAAWRQLAAAVGQPKLPPSPLAGTADADAPVFDPDVILAGLVDYHTDVLTARNSLAQAQTSLTLQRRVPIPDVATNQYHQYDNAAQTYQFGLQVGFALPLYDRNQGNIRQATAQIARATENTTAVRNDLTGRFAEAFGRYTANRVAAERYRDQILPNLARAYRALVRRWNVDEAGKVQFNDIVVAQQNLAQALQSYLTALSAQWQAVVDVANIGQLDELFPTPGK